MVRLGSWCVGKQAVSYIRDKHSRIYVSVLSELLIAEMKHYSFYGGRNSASTVTITD